MELTTNQVLLCLLALWSIGFWISGWVANKRGKDMSNIKELMRQEIERRITDNTFGAKLELIDLLAFITALPEEKPTLTVEDIKTILDIAFWNDDPGKILEEYNRLKK